MRELYVVTRITNDNSELWLNIKQRFIFGERCRLFCTLIFNTRFYLIFIKEKHVIAYIVCIEIYVITNCTLVNVKSREWFSRSLKSAHRSVCHVLCPWDSLDLVNQCVFVRLKYCTKYVCNINKRFENNNIGMHV